MTESAGDEVRAAGSDVCELTNHNRPGILKEDNLH